MPKKYLNVTGAAEMEDMWNDLKHKHRGRPHKTVKDHNAWIANTKSFVCSNGHSFLRQRKTACPLCGSKQVRRA